ncbi:hypothetical protein EOPP23_04000 [Endozoicomonas sp. OPT23]|uniref:type III secretion system translocon subunit SctE n=1 Tax=Endozoicomonas sp. OPT23 TaxID=2072845 RepID=UPI00129A4F4E|nr:type III secretion system translocon subunit SctE [Endozoicomonas sp. OPT23]MRI32158.1 hypothetical protein [Endozoicomonas sp. OPT23]
MASIGQNPTRTEQSSGVNPTVVNNAAAQDDAPVQRGFSNQNSYSRTEGTDAARPQVHAPSLDAPAADAESGSGVDDFLKQLQADGGEPSVRNDLSNGVKNLQQNPMGKEISQLRGKQAELEKMGFSKTQIDALSSLANPDDPDNSLASMHSATARMQGVDENDPRLNQLLRAFNDITVKMSALTHIPDDLQAELAADVQAFTKAAMNSKQTLDIDSATTMLIQIQSKLQNERLKFDQESIKIGQVAAEHRSGNIIQKIRDSIEKMEKAEKTALVGKIFGYIALALMAVATVVVAVVGIIFTGGVLTVIAVSLMVAAMAVMVTMIISSETDNFMMKIFDGLAGGDDDKKQKARIGAMVFWATIMIALSLGAAAAGGFAGAGGAAASTAGAATSGAATGAQVSATGVNTAAQATASAAKITAIVTKLAKLAQLVGGVSQVASGSADISTAAYTYQADIFRAEALEEKAELARIQQFLDDAMEAIEKAIDELQSGYSSLANIIKANHDTKTTLARNLRA